MPNKILLLSDLHFEFHRDTQEFISKLDNDVDILVLAGDIDVYDQIENTLDLFCDRFTNVVYVPGNHELYHSSPQVIAETRARCLKHHTNLDWLHNEVAVINGQRFLGGTGWFREDPQSAMYERNMSDFNIISDFKPWVYEEQARFEQFIKANLQEGDVVVTHHLPSEICIDKYFKGSVLNRFFVCDYTDLILDRDPALWMYGHTHFEQDLKLGNTRLVCNPRGYPHERNPFDPSSGSNSKHYHSKLITLG